MVPPPTWALLGLRELCRGGGERLSSSCFSSLPALLPLPSPGVHWKREKKRELRESIGIALVTAWDQCSMAYMPKAVPFPLSIFVGFSGAAVMDLGETLYVWLPTIPLGLGF